LLRCALTFFLRLVNKNRHPWMPVETLLSISFKSFLYKTASPLSFYRAFHTTV
jgi:hypothetical protein